MEEFFEFDERSDIWIKIFKVYTIIMFVLLLIASAILCLAMWCEAQIIGGVLFLVGGCFLAFAQAVVNMLIIQLLNNIQIIREKIDNQ
ncbi:MAG: hypothetical protein IJW64_03720 [Clostridia bacterium]|nr:hypothetical protein [Clostridia bacterium]